MAYLTGGAGVCSGVLQMELGVSYDEIDTFLEGGEVSDHARETIIDAYEATAHKRALPAAPA
mgnify:CR=1 FL=1